jgi:leader peptidase (prepilin peptidase)/N-methyltransferase
MLTFVNKDAGLMANTAGRESVPNVPEGRTPAGEIVLPLPASAAAAFCLLRLPRIAGYLGVIAIIVLSLVPGDWRPSIGLAKALEHLVAYFIVAAILTTGRRAGWPRIAGLVVLAGVLEFGQGWVPGRDPNPTDFLGSSVGALLGFGLSSLALARRRGFSGAGASDGSAPPPKPFRPAAVGAVIALGAALVLTSMAAAHGTAGWLGAGLALAMLAIAVVDGQHFLIPDPLNAAGLVLGLANSAVLGQGDLVAAMAGAALRAAVLAVSFFGLRLIYARLRGRHGIGLGDVKLAAVAGIWLDWSVMPIAVEIAALSALAVYALRRYVLRHPLRSSSRLPFGLYFAPAIWIGWLLQNTLMQGW